MPGDDDAFGAEEIQCPSNGSGGYPVLVGHVSDCGQSVAFNEPRGGDVCPDGVGYFAVARLAHVIRTLSYVY